MYMFNSNNAFTNDLVSKVAKLVQLNKNYSLIKNLIEEENKVDTKYKTELCKKFQSTGFCPYGNKCQFAHGKEELISKFHGVNYKKEKCKSFYQKGYCPYGNRCNFQHDERKFTDVNFSYFYFRIYLLEKFGFLNSNNKYNEKAKFILNKRLNVFKSLTRFSNSNDKSLN